jgi:UV DNA damage endonuclease
MRIRLGYVAIALNVKECSPSRTVTVSNLSRIEDPEARIIKLRGIARENLVNTLRILRYNAASDIKVYRMTSKLIPLATHPAAEGWGYAEDLKEEFEAIGRFINDNDMRVSSHPDHFTLLNSPREDVHIASLKDLYYHERVFDAMGLDRTAKMVLHVGGVYESKELSVRRFMENYEKLDESLRSRIILENDDKIYNAADVLHICTACRLPMVLDVHHDRCNRADMDVGEILGSIFDTWEGQGIPPKVHLSSPKDESHIRSHADYINMEDFLRFLNKAQKIGRDFDIMIEAKQKDLALIRLMEDARSIDGIEVINGGEIRY